MKRKICFDGSASCDEFDTCDESDTGSEFDYSYLLDACRKNETSYIEEVISSGKVDWDTGLMAACESGNKYLVDFMISKGENNWNAGLYHASKCGNNDLVNYMISNGATDLMDGFYHACRWGKKSVVENFINRGVVKWNTVFVYSYEEKHWRDLFVMSVYRLLELDIEENYRRLTQHYDIFELLQSKHKPCNIVDIHVKLFDRNLLKSK